MVGGLPEMTGSIGLLRGSDTIVRPFVYVSCDFIEKIVYADTLSDPRDESFGIRT